MSKTRKFLVTATVGLSLGSTMMVLLAPASAGTVRFNGCNHGLDKSSASAEARARHNC